MNIYSLARYARSILFSLIIFSAYSAIASRVPFDTIERNQSEGLTVVEVLSTLKGSGVIVNLDEEPVIITNSHNLQGLKQAQVTLPTRNQKIWDIESNNKRFDVGFSVRASVILDDPYTDFAILKFPDGMSSDVKEVLKLYGNLNGNLCFKNNCPGWRGTDNKLSITNNITAVVDGSFQAVEVVLGPKIKFSDSTIIIPAYTRPGVSGGAFYYNGILSGLVSQVSLSGEAETRAIPFKTIGKILKQTPFQPKAFWRDGALVFNIGDEEIVISSGTNGGGETGHGGGETGHGGGETGHGGGETGHGGGTKVNYLELEVLDPSGKHLVRTWNPFQTRKSSFKVNGRRISYIKVKNKLQLPTLENYLKSHTAENVLSETYLKEKRQENPQKVNRARLYEFDKVRKVYALQSDFSAVYKTYGIQKIVSESFDFPFYSYDSENFIFNLAHGGSNQKFSGVEDLLSVNIDGEVLVENATGNASKILFQGHNPFRQAVYIYDSEDLLKIERIYVMIDDFLVEMWSEK